MVKYASNNFLATKISFINEMAALCEIYGADIGRVREGMIADRRIGHEFLYPGLGYGGSCFPKDTLACVMMGESKGFPMLLSKSVHEVNQRQRERFFNTIKGHYASQGGLKGKTLAFWGLAFKPQTDDVREAPALTLVRRALGEGAVVRGFDPVAGPNAREEVGPGLQLAADMYEMLVGADGLVVSTDWDDFKSPDFVRIGATMKQRVVFDGRNLYRRQMMVDHKFAYYSIGRQPARVS
jgi:UDPglucose 6-dehydrogenase